jgi:hypothetical protein
MKKLFFACLFTLPFLAKAQFTIVNNSTTTLLELRKGQWPVELQQVIKETDTSYALQFRDQQYPTTEITATLVFRNRQQVKYFQQALSALKKLSNGSTAEFKNFSLKRNDVKKGEVAYTLILDKGETAAFVQSDVDKLIAAILPL